MSSGGTIWLIIIALLAVTALMLIFLILRKRKSIEQISPPATPSVASSVTALRGSTATGSVEALSAMTQDSVSHIFNEEFREELRNRGRLHFEKVIGENVSFLQQDLRETVVQLNEYMRTELSKTLQEEFKRYQQSINDARQLAIDSIDKTVATIDEQRKFLESQLQAQTQVQKEQLIRNFEVEMATIVNHYVLQAIGNQIDLSDQLEYILAELENNKQAIFEDIHRGA